MAEDGEYVGGVDDGERVDDNIEAHEDADVEVVDDLAVEDNDENS